MELKSRNIKIQSDSILAFHLENGVKFISFSEEEEEEFLNLVRVINISS